MQSTVFLHSHLQRGEYAFANSLHSERQLALKYEDPAALEAARRVVPLDKLRSKAKEVLEEIKKEDATASDKMLTDLLLLELLRWFKKDFFTWFDAPECDKCRVKAELKGNTEATSEEQADGARNVEE